MRLFYSKIPYQEQYQAAVISKLINKDGIRETQNKQDHKEKNQFIQSAAACFGLVSHLF